MPSSYILSNFHLQCFFFVVQASNKHALEDLHFYDHIMYLLQLLYKIGQTDTYCGEKVTFLI